jgi:hypothetical protein
MWHKIYSGLSAALIGSSAIVMVQPQVAVSQTLDEQAIASLARDFTVVINGQNPGSGAIISRDGNTYTVLTAKHVVATQDEYEIVTSDGVKHTLDYTTVRKLPGLDLAVVQFTSDKNYLIGQVGDSDNATEGAEIYISGWPHPGRAITERIFQITSGKISGRPLGSLEDGYALVYTNITRSGMSGGPILDAAGRIIGIHGRADGEPIFNPDTGDIVDVKSGFNLGIPIKKFVKFATQEEINLYYLDYNFKVAKILRPSDSASALVIAPDNQTLVAGQYDGIIKLRNLDTGEELRTITAHSDQVYVLAIAPDGRTLASGGGDNRVKLWNLETGELLQTLNGHSKPVISIAFSPDGQTLASGSTDGENTIKIWNWKRGELLDTLTPSHENRGVGYLGFRADGQTLVSGTNISNINLWDFRTGELKATITDYITCPRYSSRSAGSLYGEIVAVWCVDENFKENRINLWNIATNQQVNSIDATNLFPSTAYTSLVINPYGQLMVSGHSFGKIYIWNLHTGQLLRNFTLQEISRVTSVNFSPDGSTLVIGGFRFFGGRPYIYVLRLAER